MLKKLRWKFIGICMAIVTIMLAAIFILLYSSTKRNLERESTRMMESIAVNPMQVIMPNMKQEDIRLPYFTVFLSRTGEMVSIGGGYFDLSDEAFVQEVIEKALAEHTLRGTLNDYNLRFLRTDTMTGELLIFTDITSEKATLRNLIRTFIILGLAALLSFLGLSILLARWAVKPVDKAWKQQKQFVADASHELKTPLTVIMTDAELLKAADCPEEDRPRLTEGILTMSEQMRGLVEDLLELARMDNMSVKESRTMVSLSEIASEEAMIFAPLFFEKGLTLEDRIEPDIKLSAVRSHMKRLVDIFLDNAQKYSAPGGKTVLSLARTGTHRIRLSVSDPGEPIDPEEMQHLFERFYRADKARAMNQSYGLGLSIAEGIVTEHGGRVWAESDQGINTFSAEFSG